MDLYLIRHGETVDNVAGLYAGARDSALTNYGVEQARRLGEYLTREDVIFTHIFSSPLSRALKTAQAIQSARPSLESKDEPQNSAGKVNITQVSDLIEQDFGFYEGKPFRTRTNPKKTGRAAHHDQHKNDVGFVDVESKDSMNKRADVFIDQHLLPLFTKGHGNARRVVAIVSHGMLLSHLWRRLLLRLPSKSVIVAPEVNAARGSLVLEHPGGWSNTGYMQLTLHRTEQPADPAHPAGVRSVLPAGQVAAEDAQAVTDVPTDAVVIPLSTDSAAVKSTTSPRMLAGWSTLIVAVDRKDHLVGLKRQRGGIGGSAHDEGQQKLTEFFKRQRTS